MFASMRCAAAHARSSTGSASRAERGPECYGVSVDTLQRGATALCNHGLLEIQPKRIKAPLAPEGFTYENRYTLKTPVWPKGIEEHGSERCLVTSHAFIDESTRGDTYLLYVSACVTSDLAATRKELRGLLLPRQHRLHFLGPTPVASSSIGHAADNITPSCSTNALGAECAPLGIVYGCPAWQVSSDGRVTFIALPRAFGMLEDLREEALISGLSTFQAGVAQSEPLTRASWRCSGG